MSAPGTLEPVRPPATSDVSPERPLPRRRLTRRRREIIAAWLFLAPDVLGLLVFVAAPMLLSLTLGFFRVSGFGAIEFAGLDNYERMIGDELFLRVLRITIVYVVGFVVGVFCVSLGLALLVKEKLPLIGAARGLLFLPYVVSLVVVGLVWKFMLIDPIGMLNRLLESIGLEGRSWLGNPTTALATVIVVSIWFFMGYYMVIFLAALQDVPAEYYDAARVEGAGPWGRFRYITWPLIKPTSLFVLLLSTITGFAGLQAFDLIYIMTNGGPANATSLAVFYIYQQAFQFGDFGYAAALASVLVALLLVWSGVLFAVTKGGRFGLDA